MKRRAIYEQQLTNQLLIIIICSGGLAPISLGGSLVVGAVLIICFILAKIEKTTRAKEKIARFEKGEWWFSEREEFIAHKAALEAQEREARLEKMLMETDITPTSQAVRDREEKDTPLAPLAIEPQAPYGGEPHNILLDERPRTPSDAGTYLFIVGTALFFFFMAVLLASMP